MADKPTDKQVTHADYMRYIIGQRVYRKAIQEALDGGGDPWDKPILPLLEDAMQEAAGLAVRLQMLHSLYCDEKRYRDG
jgi:hypothetical protein